MNPNRPFIKLLSNSPKSNIFHVQKRNSFYNKYKHGPQKISNPDPPYLEWVKEFFTKDGWKFIKKELYQSTLESFKWKHAIRPTDNKLNKFEDFDSDHAISRWKPVADQDSLNGFSESKILRSPTGHALFTGTIDNRLPDDGMTQNSGFAAIIGPQAPRAHPFAMETYWNWSNYNCLEIKYRGDGRVYQIVLNTGTYRSDLEYYDSHNFHLHTRGGPYWQTLRIPFHRFVFGFKNFIQDSQGRMPLNRIKFVGIALQDKVDGPFALEIDYMGLIYDTTVGDIATAYEGYQFQHVRFKPVSVDCPVPER